MPTEREINLQISTAQQRVTDLDFKIDGFLAEMSKKTWKQLALDGLRKGISSGLDKIPVPGVSSMLSMGWNMITQKDAPGAPIAKAVGLLLAMEMYASKVKEVTRWQGQLSEEAWKVQCNQLARAIVARKKMQEELTEAKNQIAKIEMIANSLFNSQTESQLREDIMEAANPAIEMTEMTSFSRPRSTTVLQPPNRPASTLPNMPKFKL